MQSRGLDEATASQLIVMGFLEPFTKQLPMEYAVELDRLIKFQMEDSIG
jgi:Fe-S cluster assembly protein SufB